MALLSSMPLGTLIRVTEDGVPVHYELAGLNVHGAGNATLVRKLIRGTSTFGNNSFYTGSTLDTLCNTTVFNSFPAELQRIILEASIICATSATASVTLQRKCFAISYTEAGFGSNNSVAENSALSLYSSNASRIKTNSGTAASWWLRSWRSSSIVSFVYTGGTADGIAPYVAFGVAPAFVLSSDTIISNTANVDGSYDIQYATKIEIKAKMGEYNDKPTVARAILSHNGVLGALQFCNNYNDTVPTWENAVSNEEHVFANTTKTAESWAVGIHVEINREASENIYLNEPLVLVR